MLGAPPLVFSGLEWDPLVVVGLDDTTPVHHMATSNNIIGVVN